MAVELHINNRQTTALPDLSLFEHAESLGVYVPTSCVKQGKCKECMVEITEGMELRSERTPKESHLKGSFRLACGTTVAGIEGTVRCHTMRRGEMTIERQAFHLPGAERKPMIDSCVTRDGERILLDGKEIDRSTGPIHGIAMDLGTTTIVLRLLNLETGEIVADASFENPQRFGGSDVMSRIQYDTDNGTKILQRVVAGYISHAIEEFPVDPNSIYEMVVAGNTTMRDLFFRQNVFSIGQNPYRSITELEMHKGKRSTTSLIRNARRWSLPLPPTPQVNGFP